jgi:hypothetical protein
VGKGQGGSEVSKVLDAPDTLPADFKFDDTPDTLCLLIFSVNKKPKNQLQLQP